jgi:hypothetical protein
MYRRFRVSSRALVATLLASVVMATLPTIGLAYSIDGTSPVDTGCINTQSTAKTRSVDYGTIDLIFSTSGSCLTAWARFTCHQSGNCTNYVIWVHRVSDGTEYSYHQTSPTYTPNGQQRITNQLYDGGSEQAFACFQRYFGGSVECTAAY